MQLASNSDFNWLIFLLHPEISLRLTRLKKTSCLFSKYSCQNIHPTSGNGNFSLQHGGIRISPVLLILLKNSPFYQSLLFFQSIIFLGLVHYFLHCFLTHARLDTTSLSFYMIAPFKVVPHQQYLRCWRFDPCCWTTHTKSCLDQQMSKYLGRSNPRYSKML